MSPLLIVVVLLVAVVIGIVGYLSSEAYKLRKALKSALRVAIRDAAPGSLAKVGGPVRPLANQVLQGPLTGRPCVYYEAIVEEYRSSGKSGRWVEIIREIAALDFLVEDGTGRALVRTGRLKVLGVKDAEHKSGVLNDAPPFLEAFLARHGHKSQGWVFNKTLRYRECVFEPGEPVVVLGVVSWEPDPEAGLPGPGYRVGPRRAVLDAPPGGHLIGSDEAGLQLR